MLGPPLDRPTRPRHAKLAAASCGTVYTRLRRSVAPALTKSDHACITGRRLSSRSSRAYAATVFDPSTCASANSESSSSTSSWRAHSLKLDRKPWPVALMSAFSQGARHRRPAELHAPRPAERDTAVRQSARLVQHLEGVRRQRLAVRPVALHGAVGTVHTAAPKSNSSHVARRTSALPRGGQDPEPDRQLDSARDTRVAVLPGAGARTRSKLRTCKEQRGCTVGRRSGGCRGRPFGVPS